MSVDGVDHPLQNVLGALCALREEEKKERSRKSVHIISLCYERPNSNRTNT